jgi:tetratricopeptide (TPR) repeat protein
MRLEEAAEVLAHHFERSGDDTGAFRYLAMAGRKSFGVHSLDEAERYLERALALFERSSACTNGQGFAELMADYTSVLSVQLRPAKLLETTDRHLERLQALGDLPETVAVLGNLVYSDMVGSRWDVMSEHADCALAMAERLGDDRSKAYARSGWILAKCLLGQSSAEEADRQITHALEESERVDDSHLHYLVLWSCAWDCFQRGLTDRGRRYSRELQARGRRLGDPVALGAGLGNLAWFDMVDERYEDMLANASASLDCAVAPRDVGLAELLKGMALVFTGQIDKGVDLLWRVRTRCIDAGWTYITSASDMALGVAMVLQGDFEKGVRFLESIIKTDEQLGFVVGRDMARSLLAQIYLDLLRPPQRPPLGLILRNARFLAVTSLTGWKKAMTMMLEVRENPMFSGNSHWRARAEANLGFLYLLKKRHADAWECLSRARPIAAHLNSAALLAKIEAAIATIPPPVRSQRNGRPLS